MNNVSEASRVGCPSFMQTCLQRIGKENTLQASLMSLEQCGFPNQAGRWERKIISWPHLEHSSYSASWITFGFSQSLQYFLETGLDTSLCSDFELRFFQLLLLPRAGGLSWKRHRAIWYRMTLSIFSDGPRLPCDTWTTIFLFTFVQYQLHLWNQPWPIFLVFRGGEGEFSIPVIWKLKGFMLTLQCVASSWC